MRRSLSREPSRAPLKHINGTLNAVYTPRLYPANDRGPH